MNPWKISLKFSESSGTDQELEMYDAKPYFDGYLKLKRSYFDGLIKNIKMTKNYITSKAIEKVISPDNDEWTHNPWLLLLVKDNEKNKSFWFFIKREKDLSGLLVAIGPKNLSDYLDAKPSEARSEIKRLMNYLVTYLTKFKCLVFLPNFLP
ncbi:MAG: hypothetical protein JW891_04465 [Candidatus Lokiarchaeota archaeon]|nr:hypothetical protein [Candidatus Lokiarchaeota archaeon]